VAERYDSREVPLGGVRGMSVSRTLPQRGLPTVGAWCFLDQFGPQHADMRVLPHPHIGLQTVTWPLGGLIRHRDSLGSDVVLKPGQLNLMTSGRGVVHSEFSLEVSDLLHALQLWVALPAGHTQPAFEQHSELPRYETKGLRATVIIGEIADAKSPATAYTPLLGAEIQVEPGQRATVPVSRKFEHGTMVITGDATIGGETLTPGPLLYLGTGRDELEIGSKTGARVLLLGGEPFPDELVMWWNFVGRSHEEIVAARDDWERPDRDRFGLVAGHGADRIPAPPLPAVRLTPRKRA
jgi:redox-sensitive bicupin YhaK (pirin superfamily)